MNKTTFLLAAALGTLIAAPTFATTGPPVAVDPTCASSDLSFAAGSGASFLGCAGYFSGNLIKGPGADTTVAGYLSALGLAGATGAYLEKLPSDGSSLNGSQTIDFVAPLHGITYFGIHRGGAGNGSQGTAFYKIDAGAGLDTITYNLGGSSNAALYFTSAPVPEPQSYALMLVGLAAVGFVARRRS